MANGGYVPRDDESTLLLPTRACVYVSVCCPHFQDKRELLLGLAEELSRRQVATLFVVAGQQPCPHIIRLHGDLEECSHWFRALNSRASATLRTETIGARDDLELEVERRWAEIAAHMPHVWNGHRLDVLAQASVVRRLTAAIGSKSVTDLSAEYERDVLRHLIYYRDILKRHRPQVVVYFGGSFHQDRTAFITAREAQVRAFAIENAFVPDWIYIDDSGVTGVRGNVSRFTLLHEGESAVLTPHEEAAVNDFMLRSFSVEDVRSISASARRRAREQLQLRVDERVVVFLGQVEYDASLTSDGQEFKNQYRAVEAVHAALAPHANVRFLVRPHPKSDGVSSAAGEAASALGVSVVSESNHDMSATLLTTLLAADVAVTVNSQTGLQAAWLGLPVVTLGRSSYGGMGFTVDTGGHAQLLSASLETALATPFGAWKEVAVRYLSALRQYLLPHPTAASLANRVLGVSSPGARPGPV